MTDSKHGRYVANKVVTDFEPRLGSPVFFNNRVYAFSAYNPLQVYKFDVDGDGRVETFARTNNDVSGKHSYNFHASCVFKGRVYCFYDWDQGDHRFLIRYKTCADPEKASWEGEDPAFPDDGEAGCPTGASARYVWWGEGSMDTIKAVVFNDRIYLFYICYGDKEELAYSTFDGETWRFGGHIRRGAEPLEMQPHFALTTVLLDGVEHLAICSQEKHRRDHAVFSFLSPEDRLDYGTHEIEYSQDWIANDDCLSLANGSIKDCFQDNVLQLFIKNSNNSNFGQVRRIAINLETGQVGEWVDTGIELRGFKNHQSCDMVYVPSVGADGASFRHFLVVLTAKSNKEHFFSCYPSDQFTLEHEKLDVLIQHPDDVGAVTLVGVIEGVPPFSRNGSEDRRVCSRVDFGTSNTKSISVSTTFETSFGSLVKAGSYASFGLGSSFASTNTVGRRVTTTTTIPFTNGDANPDGEHGVAIISRPYLNNRNYQRRSYDGSTEIGVFHVTWISKIDVSYEYYSLEDPLPGMGRRPRSSDLKQWREVQDFPNLPRIDVHRLNSMKAMAGAPGQPSSLEITDVEESQAQSKTTLELKFGGSVEELFEIEFSGAFSISMNQTVTTEISSRIEADLQLPPGPLRHLTVLPAWLIPTRGATAERGPGGPTWIPDKYYRRSLVPWCLTWRVLDFE